MRGGWAWVGAATVLATGCGKQAARLADACLDPPAKVVAALADAPGAVRLGGAVSPSRCVRNAEDAAVLQNVGAIFSSAGATLRRRAPAEEAAALQLGYLVGAVEKGAAGGGGFQDELVFRMRSFVDDRALAPARRRAAERGRRIGRRDG